MNPKLRLKLLLLVLIVVAALIARGHLSSAAPIHHGSGRGSPLRDSSIKKMEDGSPDSMAASREVSVLSLRPRDEYLDAGLDPFAAMKKKYSVPVSTNVASPTPELVAPPMPFVVIGKKLQDGKWEVYLAAREETFIAREGDVIRESYQVVSIKPPSLELVYMPIKEMQIIDIGASYDE